MPIETRETGNLFRCAHCCYDFHQATQLRDGHYICQACIDRFNYVTCFQCQWPNQEWCVRDGLCDICRHENRYWDSRQIDYSSKATELKSTRKFGIELETSNARGHSKLKGKVLYGAKPDPSVNGIEFVSPILQGDQGLWETRGFCTRCRHMGFKVDGTCGYHLHIDVSENTNLQRRHIAAAYARTYPFWKVLVDPQRSDRSRWCRPCSNWNANTMRDTTNFTRLCRDTHRYTWFNINAFTRFKTFEIRLHQGTLDGVAVCNWVKAHLRFADFVQDMKFHEIRNMFDVPAKQMWKAVTNTWGDAALRRYYRRIKLKNMGLCLNYL